MNNKTILDGQKAVQDSAQHAIDNATKVFDLVMNRSAKLLEKQVSATKASVERHSAYANSLQKVRNVDDLVEVQERISRNEAEALEEYSSDLYEFSTKTANELSKVQDNNRNTVTDLVNDSVEKWIDSIPNGDTQPYGSIVKDAFRNQAQAFNTFGNFVDKTIAAQQANLNNFADALAEISKIAPANKPATKAKAKK